MRGQPHILYACPEAALRVSFCGRCFFTRNTLVWNDMWVAVFFLCPVTDISATVTPIGVKFCTMVHISPGHKVSTFGKAPPRDTKIPNFDREYLENGKSNGA